MSKSLPRNDEVMEVLRPSAPISNLAEGQKIFYEVKMDPKKGKASAENLRA